MDEPFLHGERVNTDLCMEFQPSWFKKHVKIEDYKFYMSMSTISIDFFIANFNTNIILHEGRNFVGKPYKFTVDNLSISGHITRISTAYGTTAETISSPSTVKSKGRKPFTGKKESKTMHGPCKSFGTSAEIQLTMMSHIYNPDKGAFIEYPTDYITKVFAEKIQIPGCRNENHVDGIKIAHLIKRFLIDVYNTIPAIPVGFDRFSERMKENGLTPFIVSNIDDVANSSIGAIKSYSRNYTFHYLPLTQVYDENKSQLHALNLYEFVKFYVKNPDEIKQWYQDAGLLQTLLIYSPHSDTSNRRIQMIFYTPQYTHVEHSRNPGTTKAFIESSGKINITLSNNYKWHDILWRIMLFIDKIFHIPNIIVMRINPEINSKTMPRLNSMFKRKFEVTEVAQFLSEFVISDDDE